MKEKKDNNGAMTNSGYAPVIIPTLNRFTHFRRCLESLERCTGADKTDVYVGLDYPPSKEYVEGWMQIDKFLAEKELSNSFKTLHVYRRTKNCGTAKMGSNFALLVHEIYGKYDSYISAEDDNEFSPNFLEYMNCMLEKYKDDDKIKSVCGYLFLNIRHVSSNTFFLSSFSNAWGIGRWFTKKYLFNIVGQKNYLYQVLYSWKKSFALFKKRSASLNGFLSMHFRGKSYGDVYKTAEMLLENEYSIFPAISKVRNWGVDGSGLHSGNHNDKIFEKQEIDTKEHFTFKETEPEIIPIHRNLDYGFFLSCYVILRYVFFRFFNKDLNKLFHKR